ncbi:MAG: hypothetical protein ACMVP2_01520 [Imperialibacter sp.]|uniref:hypothetical protein n=1 Tax=Imperialibacter sp. TaxID=2038411 RepID=UPI003A875B94
MKTLPKIMQRWLVIPLLFTLLPSMANREGGPDERRNGVYLSPGIPSFSIAYERMLKHKKENIKPYIRFIGGRYQSLFDSERQNYIAAMPTLVFGSGNHHAEAGIGFTVASPGHDPKLWGALNVGYRYQKPDGNFLFRAGIGTPEGGYLSVGIAF